MKKVKFLLAFMFVACAAFAQAPQGMNYQAVSRNAAGNILANQAVGIRITITDGNAGPTLYQEIHSDTTNQFGLFSLSVGNGTLVVGTFSSIAWSNTTPWLQVEMDPTGGSSYVLMGTSQLLSVPYALYSAQSASAPGDDWGNQTVHTTSELSGNGTTGNPIGIAQQGATNGKVLKWNGTSWVPSLDNNNTYTQGIGISIAGNVITNAGDVNAADDITNTTNANGDLTGVYPNPTVAKIRGTTISTTAPTNGQVLKYNGTQYAPAADNNTTYTQGTGINIAGTVISNTITSIGNLADVNTTGAASGQVLKYSGTQWIPGTDNTGSSSGAVNVTPRLSGDGTAGAPLDIAQQGAATGQMLGWNGTSWTPANSAANTWSVNGNDISNSNSGNVGIGTTTPQSKLDVAGNIALNENELRLRSGNNADYGLKYDAAVDGPYLFGYNGGALGTSGLPNSLEWSFTGDVSAKNNLYTQHSIVIDNASSNTGSLTNGLTFGGGSGEGIASNRSSGANQYGLDFYTGGNKNMSITNTGLVGIGTATPNYNFQLHNSLTNTTSLQITNNSGGNTNFDGALITQENDDLNIENLEGAGKTFFKNGGVPRMTITSTGLVGINQPNPIAPLDVSGPIRVNDGNQGVGKVLTSDASGNASWQAPPASQVSFRAQLLFSNPVVNGYIDVLFDSVFFNNGNGYDKLTGIFTAPSAGLYYFHVSLIWYATVKPKTVVFVIFKNNGSYDNVECGTEISTTLQGAAITATSALMNLATGETVKVRAGASGGGTTTIGTFVADSHFFGYKIY